MISFEKIYVALCSPSLLLRQVNRSYYRFRNPAGYNGSGIDVMSEDWDNF